jgi:hypothetical protein
MPYLLARALLLTACAAAAQTARDTDGDTSSWPASAFGCGASMPLRAITCSEVNVDRYGRTVAACTAAGQDIGVAMVRLLDYARYSRGHYAAEQLEAEQARRGLWSGSFMAPWKWRAR